DYAIRQRNLRFIEETYGSNISSIWRDEDVWTPVDVANLPHGTTYANMYDADGELIDDDEININYIVQDPR
mgnify:CR=1